MTNSHPGIGRLGSAEETLDYRRFGRQSFNYGDEAGFCSYNDQKKIYFCFCKYFDENQFCKKTHSILSPTILVRPSLARTCFLMTVMIFNDCDEDKCFGSLWEGSRKYLQLLRSCKPGHFHSSCSETN